MKIALFMQSLHDGGVQHVMINMYKELKKRKIDTLLIISDATGELSDQVNFNDVIDFKKMNISGDYKTLFSINKLIKTINNYNFDIIVACPGFATVSLIISNYLAKHKVKTVIMVDNKISLLKKGKLKHKISYIIYKKLYKYADSIIVAHDQAKKDIISSFKLDSSKVQRIYHPLIYMDKLNESSDLKHEYFKGNNYILLSVGRLVPEKNFSLLINTFFKIKDKIPNAKLIIIGDGPEKEKLLNNIRSLKLEKDVDMIGFYNKPMEYMKKCDLYVLSSVQEAFGIVLVEALACKMKIVSTDCESGAQKEILGDGKYGHICKCNDGDDLYNAIIDAYEDKDNSFKEENFKRGIEFSIEKSVDQYIDVFRRLI